MYKVSVPIMTINIERSDKKQILEELEKLQAKRVFFTLGVYTMDVHEREHILSLLTENCRYFRERGYEVGAWLWTFWIKGEHSFVPMKAIKGEHGNFFVCPSDEGFRQFAADYIADVAKCGVDLIMYDDDFRYGCLLGGFTCICDNHMKKISEILGETISEEFLTEKLLSGGANKYRDAWLQTNGYYMELFAEEMRMAVDAVNPDVRVGRCVCMSAWDIDGTNPQKIGRLLAGNTRPFVRLIGAPYWAVEKKWGNRLQDVIELERMERSWIVDDDMEVFAEGDAYPRPRWNCPAAYLEGFDTALRADGTLDGILKYAFDYTSGVGYEAGYVERNVQNTDLYEKIENYFAGKRALGVRVYESPEKYADTDIPKVVEGTCEIQDYFFSPAARMLAANAIPTTYTGDGICGIAFGENVKYLSDEVLKKGLILDARAARILAKQGIDVGVLSFGEMIQAPEKIDLCGAEEYYIGAGEYVSLAERPEIYRVELSDAAMVHSFFDCGKEHLPVAYTYENAEGVRFLVFTFDAHFNKESLWRNYLRGPQIAEAVKWIAGQPLPAVCHGNPDLYMMCKEKNGAMAVGLWNFCLDSILRPEITLDKEYDEICFLNCHGKMEGNKVVLGEIGAYAFAGFEVR